MELSEKDIDQLEITALALRKFADNVVEQIKAAKRRASAPSRKKEIDGVADLTSRITSGHIKPTRIRKKKK